MSSERSLSGDATNGGEVGMERSMFTMKCSMFDEHVEYVCFSALSSPLDRSKRLNISHPGGPVHAN